MADSEAPLVPQLTVANTTAPIPTTGATRKLSVDGKAGSLEASSAQADGIMDVVLEAPCLLPQLAVLPSAAPTPNADIASKSTRDTKVAATVFKKRLRALTYDSKEIDEMQASHRKGNAKVLDEIFTQNSENEEISAGSAFKYACASLAKVCTLLTFFFLFWGG